MRKIPMCIEEDGTAHGALPVLLPSGNVTTALVCGAVRPKGSVLSDYAPEWLSCPQCQTALASRSPWTPLPGQLSHRLMGGVVSGLVVTALLAAVGWWVWTLYTL